MTQITLNSEQAAVFTDSSDPICVRLPDGSIAGFLRSHAPVKRPLFTPEEIAEAERRAQANGPCFTTKEVLAHLESLDTQRTNSQ